MVLSRSANILSNEKTLAQVNKFNYFETTITADDKSTNEITSQTGKAKGAFYDMKKILKNKKMTLKVRKRVLQRYFRANVAT